VIEAAKLALDEQAEVPEYEKGELYYRLREKMK